MKAIFFDLGNVLVMYDARIAAQKFAKLLNVTEEEVWDEIFGSDLERAFTEGKISPHEFFERLRGRFSKLISYEIFTEIWINIFWLNKRMERLVTLLSEHYPLYLISNTNELHFDFIRKRFSVLDHFKEYFPSHWVGHRKPSAAIFEHALRNAKVKAKEAVFIDDVAEFVEGARHLGINGIHFESQSKLEQEFRKLKIIF